MIIEIPDLGIKYEENGNQHVFLLVIHRGGRLDFRIALAPSESEARANTELMKIGDIVQIADLRNALQLAKSFHEQDVNDPVKPIWWVLPGGKEVIV